jgi:hypothetical protein
MTNCIFRHQYNDGAKCNDTCIECDGMSNYCKRHINKRNHIFEIIEQSLGDRRVTSARDLYSIFTYIYTLDIVEDKKEMFYKIVAYLLSRLTLIKIIQKAIFTDISKYNKKTIITYLYNIFFRNHNQDTQMSNAVLRIQRFWRNKLYARITACNKLPAENAEDPFTFDTIDEIPIECRFSYKDSKGHVYIFNAIEFEYFLRTNGCWNPYTKEEIPEYVIRHLHLLMSYNKLHKKEDNAIKWHTSLQAYTEVSQAMERAGFYTSVEWFNKITFTICKNIINTYRNLCHHLPNGNMFFPVAFEINQSTYVFDLCKEIINLFKESDEHYLLCCNFIKALAVNIKEFYQNMPSWLVDSHTPMLSSFRIRGLDTMMFMYVQNLMETIDEIAQAAEQIDDDLLVRRWGRNRGTYRSFYRSIVDDQ